MTRPPKKRETLPTENVTYFVLLTEQLDFQHLSLLSTILTLDNPMVVVNTPVTPCGQTWRKAPCEQPFKSSKLIRKQSCWLPLLSFKFTTFVFL